MAYLFRIPGLSIPVSSNLNSPNCFMNKVNQSQLFHKQSKPVATAL